MICSVLQSQGDGDRTLKTSLQTLSDVYLSYFSKCLKTLTRHLCVEGTKLHVGLCSLAAKGLQKQRVLFEVDDLRRYGIGVYDTSCTFVNDFLQKKKLKEVSRFTLSFISVSKSF